VARLRFADAEDRQRESAEAGAATPGAPVPDSEEPGAPITPAIFDNRLYYVRFQVAYVLGLVAAFYEVRLRGGAVGNAARDRPPVRV
jgi:hypothetical protein